MGWTSAWDDLKHAHRRMCFAQHPASAGRSAGRHSNAPRLDVARRGYGPAGFASDLLPRCCDVSRARGSSPTSREYHRVAWWPLKRIGVSGKFHHMLKLTTEPTNGKRCDSKLLGHWLTWPPRSLYTCVLTQKKSVLRDPCSAGNLAVLQNENFL